MSTKQRYNTVLLKVTDIMNDTHLSKLHDKISPIPYHDKYDIVLVLAVPIQIYEILTYKNTEAEKKQFLNSDKFISSIYMYCYMVTDGIICEIRNACKKIAPFITSITKSIADKNIVYWVSIPIKDQKLAKTFARHGFRNPIISAKTPLGEKIAKCLTLTRYENDAFNNQIYSIENDIDYVLQQYRLRKSQCNMLAKFTDHAISVLQHLPRHKNVEHAGEMKIGHSHNIDGNIIYDVDIVPHTVMKGDNEKIEVINKKYNFHTHPHEAYIRNGMKYAWPSVHDYIGFLDAATISGTIFHIVSTLEGVYIISVSEKYVNKLHKVEKSYIDKYYRCKKNSKKSPQMYIDHINKIGIFYVQYLSWSESQKPFMIYFPKSKSKGCMILR